MRQSARYMIAIAALGTVVSYVGRDQKYILEDEINCAAATPPTQSGSEKARGKVLNLLLG